MEIREIPKEGFEKIVAAEQPNLGFRAIIAVHDTTLGRALGGLRYWDYNSFDDALTDVMRLARGMTYKSALARTGLGGGKAVIMGNSRRDKNDDILRAMGKFIDTLGGLYITAEDVGIKMQDLDVVAQETRHVTGRAREAGGSGDPSPYTALGTFRAMQASARACFGSADLSGKRVAIQGLGNVGYWLAGHLAKAGARLIVTDMHEEKSAKAAEEFKADVTPLDAIYDVEADVFAPCALGAILNDKTIPRLKTRIVCGAANNQLAEPRHADALESRNILYAPDFVVNAGGIINISVELTGAYDEQVARNRVEAIDDALSMIFEFARTNGVTTARAADQVAEKFLHEARARRSTSPGPGGTPLGTIPEAGESTFDSV